MSDELTPTDNFDALIARLASLSKKHLLFFRVEVGKTLLQSLYDGDIEAYRSQDPTKAASFKRFVTERADDLVDLGLSEVVLRQSLLAWQLVSELPREVVDHLQFTHVVELTRVEDGATRRLLAAATVDNGWSSRALKDAVQAAKAGQWIDADPAPGLQPPAAAPAPEPVLAPGRVVSRVEKAAGEFDALMARWEAVDVAAMPAAQRRRVDEALAQVEARAAAMRARLRG